MRNGVGSSGGGDAVLCYREQRIRDEVASALRSAPSDNDHREPIEEVNLRLEDLREAPAMLDLYDAHKPRGLFDVRAPESDDVRTPEEIYATLERERKEFMELFRPFITRENDWIAEPSGVVVLNDATFVYGFPKECLIAQVAHANDQTRTIHYDERVVNRMSFQSKRALRIHEDLYLFYRHSVHARNAALARHARFAGYSDNDLNQRFAIPLSSLVSDSVRELVAYFLLHRSYDSPDFDHRARRVAVGMQFKKKNWLGMTAVFRDYDSTEIEWNSSFY